MILYACVSDVRTKEVLAEHEEHEDENINLASLAIRCIESAPKFHLSYSHTTCNRIYAFLMDHHHHHQLHEEEEEEKEQSLLSLNELIFFTIADVSLGSPSTFFFLRCLRQAFFTARPSSSSSSTSDQLRRLDDDDLFLTVFHLLALDASFPPHSPPPSQQQRQQGEEDKRSKPPATDKGHNDDDEKKKLHSRTSRRRKSKGSKGKSRRKNDDCKEQVTQQQQEEEEEKNIGNIVNVSKSRSRDMEEIISVVDHHHHHHHHHQMEIIHVRGKKISSTLLSAHRMWTQYVRLVLLIDLVACILLFGIWLSVCGGFHCITNS